MIVLLVKLMLCVLRFSGLRPLVTPGTGIKMFDLPKSKGIRIKTPTKSRNKPSLERSQLRQWLNDIFWKHTANLGPEVVHLKPSDYKSLRSIPCLFANTDIAIKTYTIIRRGFRWFRAQAFSICCNCRMVHVLHCYYLHGPYRYLIHLLAARNWI